MQEELKPCPFCGGTDLVIRNGWVECNNKLCLSSGPGALGDKESQSIAAWNRRTPAVTVSRDAIRHAIWQQNFVHITLSESWDVAGVVHALQLPAPQPVAVVEVFAALKKEHDRRSLFPNHRDDCEVCALIDRFDASSPPVPSVVGSGITLPIIENTIAQVESICHQIKSASFKSAVQNSESFWESMHRQLMELATSLREDLRSWILAKRSPVPAPVSVPGADLDGLVHWCINKLFDADLPELAKEAQHYHAHLLTRQPASQPDMAKVVEALEKIEASVKDEFNRAPVSFGTSNDQSRFERMKALHSAVLDVISSLKSGGVL